MKSIKLKIILFCVITYVLTIVIIATNTIFYGSQSTDLVIFFVSCIALIACYLLHQGKHIEISFLVLSLINFCQSVTFVANTFCYKFVLGPDVSFYFRSDMDIKFEYYIKIFTLMFFMKTIEDNNTFLLGINILHLGLGLYFLDSFFRRRSLTSMSKV